MYEHIDNKIILVVFIKNRRLITNSAG